MHSALQDFSLCFCFMSPTSLSSLWSLGQASLWSPLGTYMVGSKAKHAPIPMELTVSASHPDHLLQQHPMLFPPFICAQCFPGVKCPLLLPLV